MMFSQNRQINTQLPENLVALCADALGPELTSDNIGVATDAIWNSLINVFRKDLSLKSLKFIKGQVTSVKPLESGALLLKISNGKYSIKVFCPNRSSLANSISQGAIVGVKGHYSLYRNSYSPEFCELQFFATEITNLRTVRNDIRPFFEFVRRYKRKKYIRFRFSKPLKIALLTSKSSEARLDILRNIGKHYLVEEYFVNLYEPASIASVIESLEHSDCDIILLARGGTDKLEVFNSYQILNQLFKSSKIIVTALGHASFRSLSDIMADYEFDAPSAAATNLRMLKANHTNKIQTTTLIAIIVIMIVLYIWRL